LFAAKKPILTVFYSNFRIQGMISTFKGISCRSDCVVIMTTAGSI
jgi:hypothetical protein